MGGVWGKYAACMHTIYFKSILILHDFDVAIIENANVRRRKILLYVILRQIGGPNKKDLSIIIW